MSSSIIENPTTDTSFMEKPITDINDIPAKRIYERNKLSISQKHYQKFVELINELREEIGEVIVKMSLPNREGVEIYPYEERPLKFKITMAEPKYICLNGVYNSLTEIKNKIRTEYLKTLDGVVAKIEQINGYTVWLCPKCNSYGKMNKNVYADVNEIPLHGYAPHECHNCSFEPEGLISEWLWVKPHPEYEMIGWHDGHSIMQYGKLEIVKEE